MFEWGENSFVSIFRFIIEDHNKLYEQVLDSAKMQNYFYECT